MSIELRSQEMNTEITMLPVTAGDATLITWSKGRTRHSILIDAGLREDETISYLQSIGIFHLDLIILSHPDLDHLGGLLAIMKSRTMSVDTIWCFDLNFLREFVQTGKIPPPKQATREVLYAYALRSTLDQFSGILRMANGKGVRVLQVSEGYKLCFGGILLEVLYPPQSFYDALHNPISIERMLKRKLPEDWEDNREEGEVEKAKQLIPKEEQGILTEEAMNISEMLEDGVHLSDLPEEFEDQRGNTQEEVDSQTEEPGKLPWRMVGTLYNNLSIVVKMTILGGIKASSILFPGDLSDWTTLVLRQWPNLKADILKVPHHGSKNITCDFKAICDAMDHPTLWYWLFERGYPYFYPFWGQVSRYAWRRFYHLVVSGDPLPVLRDLVNPRHLLVFPHPQHRLPSMPLDRFHSNLIANRRNRDLRSLSKKGNEATPARIQLGYEPHEIKEI